MSIVNSVLGPLDADKLGYTLMHEHLHGAGAPIFQNYPELLGHNIKDHVVDGLTRAKKAGIDTVVDASTLDMGRDVAIMIRASQESKVNIIATTGWCLNPDNFVGEFTADQFAQLFIRDIKDGIAGTGVRAGLIKSSADRAGVTHGGEIMLRAAARAHLQTNTPIFLHSFAPGEVGRQQLAILKEEDVSMNRVKVDHCLETTDVKYLTWLLEQGCYLGMDRVPGYQMDVKSQAKTFKALIDAGWVSRLMPSHDYILVLFPTDLPLAYREFVKKNVGPHEFLYLKEVFFPMLMEMGVAESTLISMCVDNPRNFFNGV